MIMDIKFIVGSLFFAVAVLSVSCFSRDLFVDHAEDSKQYIQESYMEDSFNDSTSSTETDDPGSGDESTEATSTPSTTTPTPTTTTTELTTTRPDREVPDITDETYNMELSLSFDDNCSVLVDGCGYLNKTIKDLLDEAFGNHTDDYNFQGTSIDRYNADEPEQFYTAGYTVVTYTANYDLASALNNGEVLIPAIETLVFPALKDKEINGSAIDGDYLDNTALDQLKVAGEQIELYSEDLCAWELANPENEICEFGQKCVTDPSYNESYGAVCENKCVSYLVNCDEDEGLCLINDAGNPQCSCKDNTLQISSGTCFHQNYLIFICAVGGGVLIIVVIVLVTVLLYRRRRPSNEEDRLSRVSAKDILYHERFEADEGQSFQANRPVRGGSVHSTSSAERVPRAGKSNEPPKHRHHRGHHNQAFDWDDKERIRLEELEDNKRKNDYDPYYTELLESESMKDFKPKLDHIDHDKMYAFRRPMFSSKAGEGSSQKIYESRWEDTD